MFMITSQDMYKSADKKHNIYSIRFNAIMKSMFEAGNHIIVNNSPSIYYRPALIEAEDKHPAGSILVNKLTTEGKTIPGEIYLELCAFYNGKCDKLSPLASGTNICESHFHTRIHNEENTVHRFLPAIVRLLYPWRMLLNQPNTG